MRQSFDCPILVADDGELSDVRELLDQLDLDYDSLSLKAETGDGGPVELPKLTCSLLFSTPSHAVALQNALHGSRALHVVIFDEISRTLRRVLQRSRCDFVVQRPAHESVLRLLVMHALYRGPEKRRHDRALILAAVKVKSGLLSRNATLTQLSIAGCGLELGQKVEAGSTLQLTFGKELTGGRPLTLEAKVVGLTPSRPRDKGQEVAVAFRSLTRAIQRDLKAIMKSRAVGSGALRPGEGSAATQKSDAPREQAVSAERRRAPRKRYARRVLAAGGGSARALIGRDLSIGGMRAAYDPDLKLGLELKLALHGSSGQPPIVLRTRVIRVDDESVVVEFVGVSSAAAGRLSRLVESLPSLPATGARPGVVVGEILEED